MKIKSLIYATSTLLSILLFFWGCKKAVDDLSQVPLVVERFYPNSGKEGTLVTVLGSGFGNDFEQVSATIAGASAAVLSTTDSKIVLKVPKIESGGQIIVHRNKENAIVGDFIYQELSVQNILPNRAQVGSQIKILGTGFAGISAPAKVFMNGFEAQILSVNESEIVVEVPNGTASGPVSVEVDGQTSIGADFYFMSVAKVKPITGGAGTRVEIVGEGFEEELEGNNVMFNGKIVEVLEASTQRLLVRAPEGVSTGPIQVVIGDETILGPEFTVVNPPNIQYVSPLSGPEGSEMAISGDFFSTEEGETKVIINGIEILPTQITSNQIKLIIPAGVGSGKVVVNVNDQATEGPIFKEQSLGILTLSPDNGLSGTEVNITGTGFSNQLVQNTVLFNGLPAVVLQASETNLRVRVPDGVTTGKVAVSIGSLSADSPIDFRRAGVSTIDLGSYALPSNGSSIAVDGQDNVYVLQNDRHRILKITPEGQVSIFAGSISGRSGNQNGTGTDVLFNFTSSSSLIAGLQGEIYVTDSGNRALRKISATGVVTTVIATFTQVPGRIAITSNGTLFIASTTSSVYRVNPGATASITVSGINSAAAYPLVRPAVDETFSYYGMTVFSSFYPNNIGKFTYTGSTYVPNYFWAGVLMGSGYSDGPLGTALFNGLQSFAMDEKHINLYVWDGMNFALRSIGNVAGEYNAILVSTVFKASSGFQDGDFRTARFSNLIWDMAVSKDGNAIYVLDGGNRAVRKVMFR